jgi:hypothetical protein
MAKKRHPNWPRGTPRPAEPQPIRTGTSDTADVDFGRQRTVDSTWEPQSKSVDFAPISPAARGRSSFPLSAAGITAILTAAGLLAAAVLFIGNMRSDIAIAGAKIDGILKSQEAWIGNLRAEILRVESSLDAKLSRLSDIVHGRRSPLDVDRPASKK